jgi:hypothetical protein
VTQCGGRLAVAPAFTLEQEVKVDDHVAWQHVIDGSGPLMRQDGQRLARAGFML